MTRQLSQQELEDIFGMLKKLAEGDLAFRLPAAAGDEYFTAISLLLNMAAAKLPTDSNIAPYFILSELILDKDFKVVSAGTMLFGHTPPPVNSPFEALVAIYSLGQWQLIKKHDFRLEDYFDLLAFTDHYRLVHFGFCRFANDALGTNVNIITPHPQVAASQSGKLFSQIVAEITGPYSRDAQLLQQVYDYIKSNAEDRLPPTAELAQLFYSNPERLKELFRHVLHTSIYEFYNLTRLEKSHHLIVNTSLPLRDIADLCGFSDYQHFSKAFSQHFGYLPSTLRKPRG